MTQVSGTCTVRFESDWIIGSGRGRAGGIDATVRRDQDGLPFVPAKTLTGMLRDAAERCATILDAGQAEGAWAMWVTWLFGADTNRGEALSPAHLSIRPARLPEPVRLRVLGEPTLADALTHVKPSVRIDDFSGRAADDMLRMEERATAGLICEARLEIDAGELADDLTEPFDLLTLAAAEVRRLGGDRRRGAGRCTVTLELGSHGSDLGSVLARLDRPAAPPAISVAQPELSTELTAAPDHSERRTIRLHLRSVTPIVVPQRITGNLTRSADCIPGRVLLPAILKACSNASDLATAARNGSLALSPATPAVDREPSRPVPHVFAVPKGSQVTVRTPLVNTLHESPEPGTRPLRSGFVAEGADVLVHTSPPTASIAHAVIDDDTQRPTSDVGGLYSLEALAADIEFVADLSGPTEAITSSGITKLAGSHMRIGRSKKDDYGQIEIVEVEELAPNSQRTQSSFPATSDGGVEIIVWCLSEILLRDAQLRPSTDLNLIAQELTQALGVEVTVPDTGAFAGGGTARIDGWRARWALPHATQVGLAPGTVLRFRASQEPAREHLDALHDHGIGERRAEGFGRVIVGDPLLADPDVPRTIAPHEPDTSQESPAEPDPDDQVLLGDLAVTALRRHIEAHSTRAGRSLATDATTRSRTQLGRLRQAARGLTGTDAQRVDAIRRLETLTNPLPEGNALKAMVQSPTSEVWRRLQGVPEGSVWDRARDECWPFALQALVAAAAQAVSASDSERDAEVAR